MFCGEICEKVLKVFQNDIFQGPAIIIESGILIHLLLLPNYTSKKA